MADLAAEERAELNAVMSGVVAVLVAAQLVLVTYLLVVGGAWLDNHRYGASRPTASRFSFTRAQSSTEGRGRPRRGADRSCRAAPAERPTGRGRPGWLGVPTSFTGAARHDDAGFSRRASRISGQARRASMCRMLHAARRMPHVAPVHGNPQPRRESSS